VKAAAPAIKEAKTAVFILGDKSTKKVRELGGTHRQLRISLAAPLVLDERKIGFIKFN